MPSIASMTEGAFVPTLAMTPFLTMTSVGGKVFSPSKTRTLRITKAPDS